MHATLTMPFGLPPMPTPAALTRSSRLRMLVTMSVRAARLTMRHQSAVIAYISPTWSCPCFRMLCHQTNVLCGQGRTGRYLPVTCLLARQAKLGPGASPALWRELLPTSRIPTRKPQLMDKWKTRCSKRRLSRSGRVGGFSPRRGISAGHWSLTYPRSELRSTNRAVSLAWPYASSLRPIAWWKIS